MRVVQRTAGGAVSGENPGDELGFVHLWGGLKGKRGPCHGARVIRCSERGKRSRVQLDHGRVGQDARTGAVDAKYFML